MCPPRPRWSGHPGIVTGGRTLGERLAAVGAAPDLSPVAAWRRLHEVEGARATVIDLHELAARSRGLAAHELPLAERVALAQAAMPDVWPGTR
jgi:hypothetical protein